MNRIILFAGLSALLLTGCASSVQYVPMPDQSRKLDDPAKGRIYVVRRGGTVKMHVTDNSTPIGYTGPGGYLCWEREPGDAMLSSAAENTSHAALPVRPGSVHYVLQHTRMGIWKDRTELEVVNEEQGKLELQKCKPAKLQ
jgi:RecB family endonuclease NucS